nr:hypothetical protein [Tanacetum cinerariifolium]
MAWTEVVGARDDDASDGIDGARNPWAETLMSLCGFDKHEIDRILAGQLFMVVAMVRCGGMVESENQSPRQPLQAHPRDKDEEEEDERSGGGFVLKSIKAIKMFYETMCNRVFWIFLATWRAANTMATPKKLDTRTSTTLDCTLNHLYGK